MPSTYAHYRLGNSVIECLPENLKNIVKRNYDCFALGLHGPDLLFYFKPLTTNKTNSKGYAMHEHKAVEFFSRSKIIYKQSGRRERDLCYLFGFLCHFSLDSESHGIVGEKMKKNGFSHAGVESAFDKYLMQIDGKNPVKTNTTAHIKNTAVTREVACAYFDIDEKTAKKCIKSIKFYNRLMRTHGKLTRGFVNFLLKVSNKYDIMSGMLLPLKDDERHNEGNAALSEAYERAVDKATELITNYCGYLNDTEKLSEKLNRNYE